VVRLGVQPDGKLQATDFFAPYDAAKLDTWDADFGSGGPVALPSPWFGTLSAPNLLVAVGKQGYVYLLDRSSLGGIGQGPGGADQVVSRTGPYGGVWSRPAVWPGDGGYVYMPTASGGTSAGGSSGHLQTYAYGVDGSGNPTLSRVASSSDAFGFGSSAPVVTSNGTGSGSALVWIVWSPDGSGSGAQLRAYAPLPSSGRPTLLWSAPVGQSSKFNPPGVGDNRIYVGTRDGHVLGFGAPVDPPLTSSPLVFPDTKVGQTSLRNAVFTAAKDVTVTSVSSTSARFTPSAPALPATLHTGDTFTVPVTFAPTTPGPAGGSLQVVTSEGQVNLGLSGTGQPADAKLSVSPPLVSFGGAVVGGHLAGTVTISNVGGSPLTFNSVGGVSAPFAVSGAPAAGATLAAGKSVAVNVSFSPTEPGDFTDAVEIDTSAGTAEVGLSGSATGPAHLTITPPSFSGWYLPVGDSEERSFELRNAGDTRLTLTKSKPPAGITLRATTELPEGTTIDPGESLTVKVRFAPTSTGPVTDEWDITGTDDTGPHTVTFTAGGVQLESSASAAPTSLSPSLTIGYSAADKGGPGLSAVELWAAAPGGHGLGTRRRRFLLLHRARRRHLPLHHPGSRQRRHLRARAGPARRERDGRRAAAAAAGAAAEGDGGAGDPAEAAAGHVPCAPRARRRHRRALLAVGCVEGGR
jgi:iron transport multicopper oxidase